METGQRGGGVAGIAGIRLRLVGDSLGNLGGPAPGEREDLGMSTYFCDRCGEQVNMDLDIFGDPSGDGRVVDGVVVCTACLEKEECGE